MGPTSGKLFGGVLGGCIIDKILSLCEMSFTPYLERLMTTHDPSQVITTENIMNLSDELQK